MTLRARLSLAFVLVVLLPLVIGMIAVRSTTADEITERDQQRLRNVAALTAAAVESACARSQAAAETIVRTVIDEPPATAVERAVGSRVVDWAEVVDGDGALQASAGAVPEPAGADGVDCRGETVDAARVLSFPVPMEDGAGQRLATATAGFDVSDAIATPAARSAEVAVVVLSTDGVVVGSSADAERTEEMASAARAASGQLVRDGDLHVALRTLQQPGVVVAVGAVIEGAGWSVGMLTWLVFAATLAIAALIGWLLARATARPLAELGDAAARVAAGDYDTRIPVRSRDEVGRLASAFNGMTGELRTHVRALEDSRDELRSNLARLGDTLSSTHDLNRILAVILETAMASARATAGAVFLLAAPRNELYLKVSRGLEDRGVDTNIRLPMGEGVSGRVAATGEPIQGRVSQLETSPLEPAATSVIAVPLKSSGRVIGVLDLYDRIDAEEFDASDLATMRTFASQATVAIDNVLLHQEAQRLSVTDALTGLGNYRSFQQILGREIERASRFGRALGLLMLDLDLFKSVNDVHGHQVGNAVLVEVAERLRAEVREVDVVARYGGEEFAVILPEGDSDGAGHTAERICDAMRARPFVVGDLELAVTVSIGVAVFPRHGQAAGTLVRAADEALYAAKGGGRDQWRMAADKSTDDASLGLPT